MGLGELAHGGCMPLDVFCGEQLLLAYLRPSNVEIAHHSTAVLKLLVKGLRAA